MSIVRNKLYFFKFQSDSINTEESARREVCPIVFKFQSDSINTIIDILNNLYAEYFKFQSDSINTNQNKAEFLSKATLNSNLILLIP